ncbi:translocation/assembly module TamB domain-containing protein [Flammeovirga pacifica]|uniref:Translocation and assembly module TamB C-terminal domain-containing protein n=1 Tax=Flammeovirga pacifica TaxID=915059 RepID=A0A1S1YZ08_FLAPC|nr:translocation/assembly module TamB domain-containing protein [Flammeovirga pacifica]OHX66237.1 hypothetical protein NH26_07670 [Flammeovirga pacifica]
MSFSQLPFVQTAVIHKITEKVSKQFNHPTTIKSVKLDWFDRWRLQKVQILDLDSVPLIAVEEVSLNFSFINLLYNQDRYIHIEDAVLTGANVEMIMDSRLDSMNNMTRWIRHLAGDPKGIHRYDITEPGETHILFENVQLINARYVLNNPFVPHREAGKFDVTDMEFLNIDANVSQLRIDKDTIAMKIEGLHAFESRSRIRIKDMDADFGISTTGLILKNLYGKLGSSFINGEIAFDTDDYTDYNDFYYCVFMKAKLKNSNIHTDDLANFFTYFDSIHDYISGDVQLEGRVNDLEVKKSNLRFGQGSTIRGDFKFNKIIDKERTIMDLKFDNSYYFTEDLLPYIPVDYREYVELFGATSISGEFKGTLDEFMLDGILNSEYGVMTPKMEISIPKETYIGYLKTDSLNVGQIFDVDWLGRMDFNGNINGKGFSVHKLKLNVDARIHSLELNDYTYHNIYLDSTYMKEGYFNGGLRVNDPNLKMYVDGLLDFRDSTFHFSSGILAEDLQKLNFTKKKIGFQTSVEAEFDNVIDNGLSGGLFLDNTKLYNAQKELDIDKITFVTTIDKSGLRLVNLDSDFLGFNMAGYFNISTFSKDINQIFKEAQLSLFDQSSQEVADYYNKKEKKIEENGVVDYSVDMDLQVYNINNLLSIFTDSISIANNTQALLAADFGSKQHVSAQLYSDHLSFYDVTLDSNVMIYDSDKKALEDFFDTSVRIESKDQNIKGVLSSDFSFQAFSIDRNMMFNTQADFYQYNTKIDLKGDVDIHHDSLVFSLPQSRIKYQDKYWTTASTKASKVIVYQDGAHFENFQLFNEDEQVLLDGFAKKDTDLPLHIKIDNLNLAYLPQVIDQDVKGVVDSLDVYIEDIFTELRVYGHVDVKDLELDEYYLGHLSGKSDWTKEELNMNLNISDSTAQKFKLTGSYYPMKEEDQFDMKLEVKELPLGIFQPYVNEVVDRLDGVATGWIKIYGTKEAPKLWGNVLAKNGNIKMVYLNVDYKFGEQGEDAKIVIRPTSISTENLKVVDEYGHFAFLNGGLTFEEGFNNMITELGVSFEDFFIMKKEEVGNDLFYGTAFGSGNISIAGPFDDIIIDVNAKTNKRTKIYIPLNAIDYAEGDPYIVYVQKDTVSNNQTENEIEEKKDVTDQANFQVNMNLDITPDAYCEMIFDKKSGDIIRGNGEGKLQMKIDKFRNFEMFGNVEIVKGAYNFTMKVAEFNLVDKKFVINPGSTLSWNGDPYSAQMDIVAKYNQRVSLLPLIDVQDSTVRNAPEITKRYPTDVDLLIKGDLSTPVLNFDIDIHDYPATVVTEGGPISLESYVAGFEERIHRDEQELNRQVFGLIVLRQLLSNDSYTGFGQTASSSVSELLTNQLSYILSQVDENFEVDLDMSGLDREALQNLQMRLSYTFAQGKVRVTRDGGFTDNQNQTTAASVLGDWTVEVVLSQDGALRMKFYQKYRQDVYYTTTNQDNTSLTGASMMHTKSFDKFKDITQSPTKRELTKKPKGYRKYIRKKKREEKKANKHHEKHSE